MPRDRQLDQPYGISDWQLDQSADADARRQPAAPRDRCGRRHRDNLRRPEQEQPHHACGIVSIVVVANTMAAPTKDPSVRPSRPPILDPTTKAQTTSANLRYGE